MGLIDEKVAKTAAFAKHRQHVGVSVAVSQTDRAFYVDKPGHGFYVDRIGTYVYTKAGTVTMSGTIVPSGTGTLVQGALAIDATPEKFQLAVSKYLFAGVVVEKAAATAIQFTAAHVVAASCFGVILVQINSSGTVSTKVPASTQSYTTAAEALTHLPTADSGKVAVGTIKIAAKAATWTANTDDMTNGSDLTTATFTANTALTSFAAGITMTSLTQADATLGVAATRKGTANDYVVWRYTTDGSGALTNPQLTMVLRPFPLSGEQWTR